MGRVGLLTYFYNYLNAGTLVQAWCLSRFLAAHGLQNEVVRHFYMKRFAAVNGDETDPCSAVYRRFITDAVPWSPRAFEGEDFTETAAFVTERYRAVVVGSDEVWKFARARRGRAYQIPVPNLYWPDHRFRTVKIAYAATIGSSKFRHLGWFRRGSLARSLASFSLISVRDRATQQFVKRLTGKSVELLPDPTFAVDPCSPQDKENVRALLREAEIADGRPVVAVTCEAGEAETVLGAIRRLGLAGAAILDPTGRLPGAVALARVLTPPEWFAAVAVADFAVTTRMHGTIASLVGDTPCCILDHRSKTHELALDFGLPASVFEGDSAERISEAWPSDRIKETVLAARLRHEAFVARMSDSLARAAA